MTSHRPSALPVRRRFLLLLLLLLVSISAVRSRSVRLSDPVSNGLGKPLRRVSPPYLPSSAASSDSCDETYGFMPCTTTWIGNLFLIVVYGYLMYTAAKCVSAGSEMLLENLGPGLIGGLVVPWLGALPDALLILVCGLSGSTETAQSQVSVGMGLLAGSAVMLLTVIWGSCVLVGKCDLQNSTAVDKVDTKGFNLTGSGITIDDATRRAAWIMVISVIPFLVIQLLQLLNSTSGRHVAVLMVLILSVALLISYCLYQVFQPQIQVRRRKYWEMRHVIFGFLGHVKKHAIGRLMKDDGEVDTEIVDEIFKTIDADNDDHLTKGELKAFVIGIRFEEIDLDVTDAVDKIMAAFDTSHDNRLSKEDFRKGIKEWLKKAVRLAKGSNRKNVVDTMKIIDHAGHQAKKEHEQLLKGEQSDVVVEVVENVKMTSLKAVGLLILGTVIAAAFADPLVDAVDNFSDATGIPTFFISFIVLPLATGSGEAVMAISVATRKKQKTASLIFSEFYGRVTVKNLLCLAVFLVLVYIRELTWDFTSEVIIILIVCVVMGIFASFRATYPLWTSLVAFVLYPFSLALVYVLNHVLGWL